MGTALVSVRQAYSTVRGLVLPNYRLYRLDGAGKISAADWIEAADDTDACQRAEQSGNGGSYEIWDRQRLVIRVRPEVG